MNAFFILILAIMSEIFGIAVFNVLQLFSKEFGSRTMTDRIANTYRFFVSETILNNDSVVLTDNDLVHQLSRVLRLHPGNHILLLDGLGNAGEVVLSEVSRRQVVGQVVRRAKASGEPSLSLDLYIALLRAERFEWVLQKGTEIGVRRFIPVEFTRSLISDRVNERKLARWRRIVQEAAEQSCRGVLPEVTEPQPFLTACKQVTEATRALILWEGVHQTPDDEHPNSLNEARASVSSLRSLLRSGWINDGETVSHTPLSTLQSSHLQTSVSPASSVYTLHKAPSLAVFSGPEGGITPEELTIATEHGIIPTTLGPRILRAETAPIVAVASIFYELEE